MSTTTVSQPINAPRAAVYQALIDPVAVADWMVPDGMTSEVHAFEAREGGMFRISLTYDDASQTGKSSSHTDTYHGQFVTLTPDRQVVQTMAFETDDPALQGTMTATFTLTDAAGGGTLLHAEHASVPPGIRPEDNQLGWAMSLAKLAHRVEGQVVDVSTW